MARDPIMFLLVFVMAGLVRVAVCFPPVVEPSYTGALYRGGPPAHVYNPLFSVLMFRILLETNPHALQRATLAFSKSRPPVSYNSLAGTRYFPRFRTVGIYGYTAVDAVRDSQPFGISNRVQDLV